MGRIARMNTRIPMPPIQWEKLLHIRVACDISSTLGIILDPVVVKPDTISNMASMIWGISPLMTKGMHPKKLNTIHPRETVTNPSLAKNIFVHGFFLVHINPSRPQTAATPR